MRSRNLELFFRKIGALSLVLLIVFVLFSWPSLTYGQGGGGGFTFENPLKAEFGTVSKFIGAILGIVVQIGTPVLVLMIIWSGFLFVTARGRDDQLNMAKKTFMYTVIGAAIVLGAFVIQQAIEGTVNQLRREP